MESSPCSPLELLLSVLFIPFKIYRIRRPLLELPLIGLHRITLVIIGNVIFEYLPQNPLFYFEKCLISIEIYCTIMFQT